MPDEKKRGRPPKQQPQAPAQEAQAPDRIEIANEAQTVPPQQATKAAPKVDIPIATELNADTPAPEPPKPTAQELLAQRIEQFRQDTMIRIPLLSINGRVTILTKYMNANWIILYDKIGRPVQQLQFDEEDWKEFKERVAKA